MKLSVPTLLAGALLAMTASGQTVVLPNKFANARENTDNWYVFSATAHQPNIAPYHGQWIYDAASIPVPMIMIGSMSLRRMSSSGNTLYLGDADIDISIGTTTVTSATAATTFASNIGTALVNIFPKAKVNLPQSTYVAAPNLPPWVVTIPFQTPFPYVAASGLSLLLDIKSGNYAAPGGGSVGDNWFIDCGKAEEGQ